MLGKDKLDELNQHVANMADHMTAREEQWADKVCMFEEIQAETYTPSWLSRFPEVQDHVGEKVYEALRFNALSAPVETLTVPLSLPETTFRANPNGVAKQIEKFFAREFWTEKFVEKLLLGGLTKNGYDDVPFFSTAHPLGQSITGGSTWSNTGTDAFDATNFKTALAKMQGLADENGRPYSFGQAQNVWVIVGPNLEYDARTVLEAPLSGGGNTNVLSNRVAGLIVTPRFRGDSDNYWAIVDASAPAFAIGIQKDFTFGTNLNQYRETPNIHMSVDAAAAFAFGMPQGAVLHTAA